MIGRAVYGWISYIVDGMGREGEVIVRGRVALGIAWRWLNWSPACKSYIDGRTENAEMEVGSPGVDGKYLT